MHIAGIAEHNRTEAEKVVTASELIRKEVGQLNNQLDHFET